MILINHESNLVDNLAKFIWKSPNPNKKLETKDVEEFIENFNNNKIPRYYHSEDVPKKNPPKTGIFSLVQKNFYEFLSKHAYNDTLILFCTHINRKCNRLEFIYEKLAKKLKNNKNLVIGFTDPSQNELNSVNIEDFPHLVMIKASPPNEGVMSPEHRLANTIKYNGNYTLSELINFVETNTYHKVNVTDLGKKKEEKILKREKKSIQLLW